MPQILTYEVQDQNCDCLRWRGAWDSGTTYSPYNLVLHDGVTWIAVLANTNSEPADPSDDWDVFAGTP